MNITTLKKNILKNKDGVTLNKNGTTAKHTKGFYYSITNNVVKKLNNKNINKVLTAIELLERSLKINLYVGSWFSSEHNKWFIDVTLYEVNLKTALKEAKKFNQLAVFDIKNLKTIEV